MLRKKLKRANDEINNTIGEINTDSTSSSEVVSSKYFSSKKPFWQELYDIECAMCIQLSEIKFSSSYVYNPISYASELHCAYMEKFLDGPKTILFVGVNPGPWGMCQTGVPFGVIWAVKDWMQLHGNVLKPVSECSDYPVKGLDSQRKEQSGDRFWSVIKDISGDNPSVLFKNSFIYNWCPFAFFQTTNRGKKQTSKNQTPDELKTVEKNQLSAICDETLIKVINLIKPKIIVTIGRYVDKRIAGLIKINKIDAKIEIKCIKHPSPRSVGNQNWVKEAKIWFQQEDLLKYMK